MSVDWTKPIVTNLGLPAEVVKVMGQEPQDGRRFVAGVFAEHGEPELWTCYADGRAIGNPAYFVRNAAPAAEPAPSADPARDNLVAMVEEALDAANAAHAAWENASARYDALTEALAAYDVAMKGDK